MEGHFNNLRASTVEQKNGDLRLVAQDDVEIECNSENDTVTSKKIVFVDHVNNFAEISKSGIDLITVGGNIPRYKIDGVDISAGGGSTTNASALISGTLADARLSANVPLLDSNGDLNVSTIPTLAQSKIMNLVSELANKLTSASSLNADNLSSGTVPSDRLDLSEGEIPALPQSKITNLVNELANKLTATSSLNADNLSSGTVPSAQLDLSEGEIPALPQSKITNLTSDLSNKLTATSSLNADNLLNGTVSSDLLDLVENDIPTLPQSLY